MSATISFMTQLAQIRPAVDGTNAFEAGGISALRIGAFGLPTVPTTSSRITTGLSSVKYNR